MLAVHRLSPYSDKEVQPMRIGVPKERVPGEGRVGLLPDSVRMLVRKGHEVFVESGAGVRSGATDEQFEQSGASLVSGIEALYGSAELIVKVKEPQPEEVALLRESHILFGFLHLAAHPGLLNQLTDIGTMAIAYESICDREGHLPVLSPMSRIAGTLAVHMGTVHLFENGGGKGVLLGGIDGGRMQGEVVVLGCGSAGKAAIATAVRMGARVTALDIKPPVLESLQAKYEGCVTVMLSTETAVAEVVRRADLVVGAVLVPGAKAPVLVRRGHVRQMEAGSVIVDIAIDQGGCIETSHPTTLAAPTFIEEGVVHCCVTNLPAAVSRTAARELISASAPYVLKIAQDGRHGVLNDPILRAAVNVMHGTVTNEMLQTAGNL